MRVTKISLLFFGLCFLCVVFFVSGVSADGVWSVDTEDDWNSAEDISLNTTVNTTGLLLNIANWNTLMTNGYESDSWTGSYETRKTFTVNTLYDAIHFITDICYGGSAGTGSTRLNNGTTLKEIIATSDDCVSHNVSVTPGVWGTTNFQNYKCVTDNTKVIAGNYSTNGYWNSSWHDFSTTYVLNQVNFSVDSLGGGLTYQIQVSDDGVSVKDETSWTSIAATGDITHNPVLNAARYMRIRFNLTKGSTPLVDSFDFLVSENTTPNIVSTVPSEGQEGVETSLSQINVTINDLEGDTFNWSIETIPDIGSNSANDASNGTKTCSVSGLVGGTTYTVFVNVTDSAGNILNYSFDFTTYGTVWFYCYDETSPSTSISPFELKISNGHAYENDSLNSGDNISIADLPFGDDVVFVVSAENYETRVYTFTISSVADYNFSFYLPPEANSNELKSNSTYISNPALDAVINLECEPERIIVVQGWNESFYGHWFNIPDDKWSLSGSTLTVDSSMLDENTSVVQAQYYCGDQVLEYVIHVINSIGVTLDDALINVSIISGTSYVSVHSVLTDGNGDATVSLIPGQHYKIRISKTDYVTEVADFTPTENVRTKTYRLEWDDADTNASHWMNDVDISAELSSSCTLYLNYTDASSGTSSVNVTVEIWNGSAYNSTVYYYNSSSNSFSDSSSVSCAFGYRVVFNVSHDTFGNFTHTIMLNYQNGSVADADTLDEMFTSILGENPFGWINFIAIFVMLVGLFTFGEQGAGISLIGTGMSFLFLNVLIVGFVASTMIPILFVILGFLVEWMHHS